LVEPEVLLNARLGLRSDMRVQIGHEIDGAARRQLHEAKADERDPKKRREKVQKTAREISGHRSITTGYRCSFFGTHHSRKFHANPRGATCGPRKRLWMATSSSGQYRKI